MSQVFLAVGGWAAPPGGHADSGFLKWAAAVLGVLLLFGAFASWDTRRQRRNAPSEQRAEELRQELRSGIPNARGHVRIDPAGYPGTSAGQAEDIAREEGFLRQSHGAGGQWLFYRMDTQPGSATDADVRGSPAPEAVRESAAAQRAAHRVRERDGFAPLDEAILASAEKGLQQSRAKSDRAVVGAALAMLAGLRPRVSQGSPGGSGCLTRCSRCAPWRHWF
ncbi:hypothetical protein [Streptomyces pinistramenti]|uniref:hypothetical protein n=1 Tax=Streptomyces pinistramenti TaxID=2884812 RepID=UPI001D06C4B2|nr:hypothetical protein [Streptomyces pinistramenti]MCB5910171.1 hypothetical protein [Streptomyces pinistramenti]